MLKNIYLLLFLAIAISFSGCSRVHRPYKEVKKGVMVYQISYKRASQLIYQAITEEFPNLEVKSTKMKDGYFVDYRFMTDEQRYTIKLKLFRGNVDNRLVQGFSFKVFSTGTRFISAQSRKRLLENAMDKFKSTSRGVIIQNAIPIKLKYYSKKAAIPRRYNYTPAYTVPLQHNDTSKKQVKGKRKETLETKLNRALMMYKSGLINNHEYYNMRQKLLINN